MSELVYTTETQIPDQYEGDKMLQMFLQMDKVLIDNTNGECGDTADLAMVAGALAMLCDRWATV